eukprot:gnl/TRDRNA2_/TRDRNA2_34550_c0_seq1.p1 gnl/TRDRNA2_/TRDRNA2_34550_c0~~gnl/TRDRNA2_/TRDRNA2_34550_c0_seq1.p1  ORF type:complete len:270 (+),score=30.88 gnl/TRDRNA2_/TRDRNA2_34550_c0_seq1:83-892(+)
MAGANTIKDGEDDVDGANPLGPLHKIWGKVDAFSGTSRSDSSSSYREEARVDMEGIDFSSESTSRSFSDSVVIPQDDYDQQGQMSQDQDQAAREPVSADQAAELHASGKCMPCHYINSKRGCERGANCTFCHLEHVKPKRPCKSNRNKCRRVASALDNLGDEELPEVTESLLAHGSYMRMIVKRKLNARNEPNAAQLAKELSGQHNNDDADNNDLLPDPGCQGATTEPSMYTAPPSMPSPYGSPPAAILAEQGGTSSAMWSTRPTRISL